jgi:hypothetical protein
MLPASQATPAFARGRPIGLRHAAAGIPLLVWQKDATEKAQSESKARKYTGDFKIYLQTRQSISTGISFFWNNLSELYRSRVESQGQSCICSLKTERFHAVLISPTLSMSLLADFSDTSSSSLVLNGSIRLVCRRYHPPRPLLSFGLCKQFPVHGRQTIYVRSLRQHLGLKPMESGGQGRTVVANLHSANQAEGRIVGKTLGVVEVFITGQAAVASLA